MAYELTTRHIRVKLRGTEFAGVEARAEYPTVAEYLEIYRSDQKMLDGFAGHLLDWNLEQDGEPVPPTADGMKALPPDLALSLAAGWLRAATAVVKDRPLSVTPELNGEVNGEAMIEAL